MASVLAMEEVWPARNRGLLPSVRPVTTLLATGIVIIFNTSGVIKANSIGTRNGMIVLSAGTAGTKPAGTPTQVVPRRPSAGMRKNPALRVDCTRLPAPEKNSIDGLK